MLIENYTINGLYCCLLPILYNYKIFFGKGVQFSLDEYSESENKYNLSDVTEEYVNSHPREYKEKIRNLDKAVWKKELVALAKQADRMEEAQKIIDRDRKKRKT